MVEQQGRQINCSIHHFIEMIIHHINGWLWLRMDEHRAVAETWKRHHVTVVKVQLCQFSGSFCMLHEHDIHMENPLADSNLVMNFVPSLSERVCWTSSNTHTPNADPPEFNYGCLFSSNFGISFNEDTANITLEVNPLSLNQRWMSRIQYRQTPLKRPQSISSSCWQLFFFLFPVNIPASILTYTYIVEFIFVQCNAHIKIGQKSRCLLASGEHCRLSKRTQISHLEFLLKIHIRTYEMVRPRFPRIVNSGIFVCGFLSRIRTIVEWIAECSLPRFQE